MADKMTAEEVARDVIEEHGASASKDRLVGILMGRVNIKPTVATDVIERELNGDQPPVDLAGFENYLDQRVERDLMSGDTRKAYLSTMRRFQDWYDGDTIPTGEDIEAWLDHLFEERELSPSAIQRHFYGIRWYFDEYLDRGETVANIDISSEYPSRNQGQPDYLPWEDVEQLRAATVESDPQIVCLNLDCDREPWDPSREWTEYETAPRCPTCDSRQTDWTRDPREYVILQLLTGFGMRVGELVGITLDQVDIEQNTLHINRQKRRGEWTDPMWMIDSDIRAVENYLAIRDPSVEYTHLRYARTIPESWLSQDWYAAEAEATDHLLITNREGSDIGWRMGTAAVRRTVRRVADRADLDRNVTPHLIRDSVGAKLQRSGFTEYQVGRYLGHSAMSTSGRSYMPLDPEQFREMREELG